MSEIRNENKKVALPRVNMYLGKNKKGDIIAFPAGSLFVSGRLGSGMNTFYNNLLLSFVENCKPDTYNLHLWSDYECSVWYDAFDSKHRLTSFKEINYAFEGKACEKSLVHFICTACDEIKRREALQESDLLTREFYVIDLSNPNLWDNFYDTTQEGICNILCMYISRGDAVGVHFVLTTQLCIPDSRLPKLFTYRASLRNHEESSRQVLGSDIAYADDNVTHGVIWVKSDYDDVPVKLWYTFRPNTFIKKIIKAFGVSSEWSEEEIKTLRSLYPERGVDACKFLEDRTEIDCLRKAHELGIDTCNRNLYEWTEKEDAILREHYPSMGVGVEKLLPNKFGGDCIKRADMLGIQRNPIIPWTEEEDTILRENYPSMGRSVCKLLSDRSASACQNRAQKLGLKYVHVRALETAKELRYQSSVDSSLTEKQREYIQEIVQRHTGGSSTKYSVTEVEGLKEKLSGRLLGNVELTERECEVLNILIRENGQGI